MPANTLPNATPPEIPGRDMIGIEANQLPGQIAATKRAAEPGDRYQIFSCRSPDDLAPYLGSWEQLSVNADEPNVFYEPWALLPALRLFAKYQDIRIVMVHRIVENQSPQVVGLFPFQFVRRFRFVPILCARLWRHPHCYLGSPLIARNAAEPCWGLVYEWLRRQRVQLLELDRVPSDSAQFESLAHCCRAAHRPLLILHEYPRPLLRLEANASQYLSRYLSAAVRQTLTRKRRRLAECGHLEIATLQSGDDPTPWLNEFLTLEASGWKGREGTAMTCHQEDRDFMAMISHEAHQRNRLSLVLLRVEGKAIAGLYNLYAGEGAFQFKVAYDEQWGRFSPGILAYLETLHVLHEQRRCQWIDSCVAESNTAARQVWKQHRQIGEVVLAVGPQGAGLLRLLPTLQKLKRAFRGVLRRRARDTGIAPGSLAKGEGDVN